MKVILLLICLLFCAVGSSRDFVMKKKRANRYYSHFDFHRAIPIYEKILKKDPQSAEIYEKLANIYDRINDSQNAERCYAFLTGEKDNTEIRPFLLLNYARALSRNGKYPLAASWYKRYQEAVPEDPRGAAFSDAYQNMELFYKDSACYTIQKAPFSSDADDFSPAYFQNIIVFSSDRTKFSMVRSTYNWTKSSYLDLYVANPEDKEANPFSNKLNSIYHEGPVTFSKNQDTIIFTRSNYFNSRLHKSKEGINKLSLFEAIWDSKSKTWINIQPLSLNDDQYSNEHPALCPDGTELYFASDKPGGMGGMDLYVSHHITDSQGTGSWSPPINLGPGINTPGNDMFPFVDHQGNLWYASNGIPGLGGLDVFFACKLMEGFSKPINPGYPFNTRFDDFGFITLDAGESGYLSSDRYNSFGNDDIFSIKQSLRHHNIWVFDEKTKKSLPFTRIVVSEEGAEPVTILSNSKGREDIKVNPFKSYRFLVANKNYKDSRLEFRREKLQELDTIKVALVREAPLLMLKGFIFSATDNKPVQGATIVLRNKFRSFNEELKCDANGLFQLELQPESDYQIKVAKTGTKIKCWPATINLSTKGIRKDSTFTPSIPVYFAGDVIVMKNINYKLDRWDILPETAKELDHLVLLMNENPELSVELRSHAISTDSKKYNMELAQYRADAAVNYVRSKGITAGRIVAIGYGETQLITKSPNGFDRSPDQNRQSSRTEIFIPNNVKKM
ncbi:MAG: OmpA family protein [Mariniphaga sp.]|nr:OmpA family protein [Mariniphaga sp.]